MASFYAQPEGPGLFLRDAALLDAYLAHQTSHLAPCLAQKQAPARRRRKREQTLAAVTVVDQKDNRSRGVTAPQSGCVQREISCSWMLAGVPAAVSLVSDSNWTLPRPRNDERIS